MGGLRVSFLIGLALVLWVGATRAEDSGGAMGTVDIGWTGELDAMKVLRADRSDLWLVYGDRRGLLHILKRKKNGFAEVWDSRTLGGPIAGVFVEDVNLDGADEIVVYTLRGDLYYFDAERYTVIWQNSETEFRSMMCMAVENVDGDPQKELIFCADSYLYIYDAKNLFEEWRSDQEFAAQDIAVADVDGDGALEIVLNTGFVLDARFRDMEWQAPEPFGDRIRLLDVDDDDIPEVIGESLDNTLNVFDIDLKQEKL